MGFIALGLGKARLQFLLREAEQDALFAEANLLLASSNGRKSKEEAQSAPVIVMGAHIPKESEQKTT
jgi:hypothetical protein